MAALASSLLVTPGLSPSVAADAPATFFLLDGGAPALHAIDTTTGRVLRTAELSGHPLLLMATPDGSRLLVLDRGPGRNARGRGWVSAGPSAVTIVDADRMRVLGRVELGWGLSLDHGPLISADGRRLALVCPGYQAGKSRERSDAELVVVDVAAAKVTGRVVLDRPPVAWVAGMNGRRAYALLPRRDAKKAPSTPASLVALDLETGAAAGQLQLDGDVTDALPAPDGRLLYLLDRGTPSSKPEKNVNGRLHVVSLDSLSSRGVLDAGSDPRGLFFDKTSQAVLVPTKSTPVKGTDQRGELRAVRGEKLGPVVPITSKPLFLRRSADGRQLYAVGPNGLTVVSLPALTALREARIEGAGLNWTSDAQTGPPNDMATTPDGARGLLTYENSSKLLILDLASGNKIASVNTGRKGVRLLKVAAVTALNASSYYAARERAIHSGQRIFSYSIYGIRAASTTIAVRADGRFAYVLNALTDDVTVVDTADGRVVDKLGAGGYEILALPTGRHFAVLSDSALHLLDSRANAVVGKWELPGLLGAAIAPDAHVAVAVAEKSLLLFDPASGEVTARVDSFVGNTCWLFVAPRPAPRAGHR